MRPGATTAPGRWPGWSAGVDPSHGYRVARQSWHDDCAPDGNGAEGQPSAGGPVAPDRRAIIQTQRKNVSTEGADVNQIASPMHWREYGLIRQRNRLLGDKCLAVEDNPDCRH